MDAGNATWCVAAGAGGVAVIERRRRAAPPASRLGCFAGTRQRGVGVTSTAVDVPVREGVYGREGAEAVEPGGIEYIAPSERHGSPRQGFWTWTSPNLEFATVFIGVLPVVLFGGGFFWATSAALLVGTALGSAAHGLLSAMGPRLGVAQMVESRAGFGFLGNLPPRRPQRRHLGGRMGGRQQRERSLRPADVLRRRPPARQAFTPALGVIVLIEIGIAFTGHNFIHAIERWVFPFLAVVFAACCLAIFWHTRAGAGFDAAAPDAAGGPVGAFMIARFLLPLAYAVSWNPYASDYQPLHGEVHRSGARRPRRGPGAVRLMRPPRDRRRRPGHGGGHGLGAERRAHRPVRQAAARGAGDRRLRSPSASAPSPPTCSTSTAGPCPS